MQITQAPLVSVILSVAGPSAYLSAAVTSILQQTLQDIELLLVTYPYPPGITPPWINAVPADERVRWLQRDNPGLVSALNAGIATARGTYLARMDADDLAEPQRLELQLAYLLEQGENTIVGACVELFSDAGQLRDGNQRYQQWLNSLQTPEQYKNNLLVESPLPHPTWFAKTSLFRQLGGYRECAWAEDYDFLLRANQAGLNMGKPGPVLLRWREHEKRLTHMYERYSRLNFTRAKAWALAQSFVQSRSVIICGTGRNTVRLHDALSEEGVCVRGFVEHAAARQRTSRRHLPVFNYSQLLTERPDSLLVTAVTANGARDELRTWFGLHGFTEMKDYVIAG